MLVCLLCCAGASGQAYIDEFKKNDSVSTTLQVASYGASGEAAAMTSLFTRLLQHSLKDSRGLSQHPAATGPPNTPALPKKHHFGF